MSKHDIIRGIYQNLNISPHQINYENINVHEVCIMAAYDVIISQILDNEDIKPFEDDRCEQISKHILYMQYENKDYSFDYEEDYIRQLSYKLWCFFKNNNEKYNWDLAKKMLKACSIIEISHYE